MISYEIHSRDGYHCSIFPSELEDSTPGKILAEEARLSRRMMYLVGVENGIRTVLDRVDPKARHTEWDDFELHNEEDDE